MVPAVAALWNKQVTSPLELHLLDEADYFLLPSFVNVKRQQEQQQRQQQQQQTPQQSAHQRLQEQLTAQLQMPPVRAGLARLPMQVRAAAAAAARFLGPTTVKTPADVVESAGSGSVSELGREGSSDGAAFAARRARKPAQPRRATLDDASSGGAEKNKA
jgi:type II secretory pathway pseudopilin PulG